MSDQTTLAQRVSSSFQQLKAVANDLNAVSDELGKSVAQIDSALKNLNLGITAWVQIDSWYPGDLKDYEHWSEHIGYAKISGKWGICLKQVAGDHRDPEGDKVDYWLFNDAPRTTRLKSIDKIPALLEQISARAVVAIKNIQEKLGEVKTVAAAVAPPLSTVVPPLSIRRLKNRAVTQASGSVEK